MTGAATSPATTLGRAPSMPATATIALAARRMGILSSRRCSPATPTSYRRSTALPISSAVTAASSATRRAGAPGGRTAAAAPPPSRAPPPGRPAAAPPQPLGDRRQLLRRLPLAQHNLREPLAESAVMVQLREAHLFVGQVPQPAQRLVHGHGAAL